MLDTTLRLGGPGISVDVLKFIFFGGGGTRRYKETEEDQGKIGIEKVQRKIISKKGDVRSKKAVFEEGEKHKILIETNSSLSEKNDDLGFEQGPFAKNRTNLPQKSLRYETS
jgi:hypothetical protein